MRALKEASGASESEGMESAFAYLQRISNLLHGSEPTSGKDVAAGASLGRTGGDHGGGSGSPPPRPAPPRQLSPSALREKSVSEALLTATEARSSLAAAAAEGKAGRLEKEEEALASLRQLPETRSPMLSNGSPAVEKGGESPRAIAGVGEAGSRLIGPRAIHGSLELDGMQGVRMRGAMTTTTTAAAAMVHRPSRLLAEQTGAVKLTGSMLLDRAESRGLWEERQPEALGGGVRFHGSELHQGTRGEFPPRVICGRGAEPQRPR